MSLPGKLTEEEKAARRDIDKETEKARLFLYQDRVKEKENYLLAGKTSCGECHLGEAKDGKLTTIAPVDVPDVWFKHATFNHVSHRAMDCRSCHADAYAKGADGAVDQQGIDLATTLERKGAEKVMLPALASCRECHAPQHSEGGKLVGGVRHDCTECHTYHHGAEPLQGLGAAARDPRKKGDAQQFLRGMK
jgi:hypothetical protein